MTVGVFQRGEPWDFLFDEDCIPVRAGRGVVCALCPGQRRRVFASRADLWRDHLFAPLLRWMNTTLAPARVLSLLDDRGMTQARLLRARDARPRAAGVRIEMLSLGKFSR